MSRGKRTDGNQHALDALARKLGAMIIHASNAPELGFDRVYVRGEAFIVEVKDGRLPPSKRQLTDNELKVKAQIEYAGGRYHVIESEDDLLKLFGLKSEL